MAITTLGKYKIVVSASKNIDAGGSISWTSQQTAASFQISYPVGGIGSGSWNITATPASGYRFSGWSTIGKAWSNTAASGSSATITFSKPNSATTAVTASTTWVGDTSKTYSNNETVTLYIRAIFEKIGSAITFSSNNTNYGTVKCEDVGGSSVVTIPSGSIINTGTSLTLTATPATHYHFVKWTFTGGFSGTQTANPVNFSMPAADTSAVATFEIDPKYTLTVKRNNNLYGVAGITAGGSSPFFAGTIVELTATPNASYHFVSWSFDTNAVVYPTGYNQYSNPVKFAMASINTVATANFAVNTSYTLTVNSSDTTKGSATGGGSKVAGSTVTVSASANAGYEFQEWQFSSSGIIMPSGYSVTSNPVKIIMPESNLTLTAKFKDQILGKYRVRVKVESENSSYGTVQVTDASEDSQSGIVITSGEVYSAKKNITVVGVKATAPKIQTTATPKSGYVFSSWATALANDPDWASGSSWSSGKTTSDGNTYFKGSATWKGNTAVEYDEDETVFIKVTAKFKANLTVNVSPSGSGTATGAGSFASGAEVTLKATPAANYHFSRWTFDSNSVIYVNGYSATTNPTKIIMPGIPTVATAEMAKNSFTVTTAISPDTSYGTITGAGSYAWGENVTITATPATGFKVVDWQISSGQVSSYVTSTDKTQCSFVMPTENTTVTAILDYKTKITLSVVAEKGQQCTTANAKFKGTGDSSQQVGVIDQTTTSYKITLSSSGKGAFLGWAHSVDKGNFDGTVSVTKPSIGSGEATISLKPTGQLGNPIVTFTASYQGEATLEFPIGLDVKGNYTGIASVSGTTGGSVKTSPGEYDVSFPISCTLASGYSFAQWIFDGHTADDVDASVSLVSFPGSRSGNAVFHVVLRQTVPLVSQGITITVHPTATRIYTITYKANGGTGADRTKTKIAGQSITIDTNQFTPAPGTRFKPSGGWNTKADGTGTSYSPGSNYSANADLTLYAQWISSVYHLEWDLDGGEYPTDEQLIDQGFVKKQWSGGSAWSKDSRSVTDIYNPVGSINYDNSQYTITEGLQRSSFFRTGIFPSKTGYTFEGWNIANFDPSTAQYNDGSTTYNISSITGSGTSVRTGDSSQISRKDPLLRRLIPTDQSSLIGGGVVFTARYSANEYDVTLDHNDGSGVSEQVVATYGSALPRITPPKRKGFTFLGYFDQREGGTKYYTAAGNSQRTWNKTSDTTLYAQWEFKWGFIKRFIDDNAEHCIICKGIKRWNGSSWDLVPLKKKETNDWSDPNE